MKVTALPGVMEVGVNVKSVVRASGLIVTVADADVVAVLASVAVTLIVLLPLVE